MFPSEPVLDHLESDTVVGTHSFVATADSYSISIPFDSASEIGTFLINAEDSSGARFEFDIGYTAGVPVSGEATLIYDPSGYDATLSLADTTGGLKRAVMMVTSYPVPRNGLTDVNRRIVRSSLN